MTGTVAFPVADSQGHTSWGDLTVTLAGDVVLLSGDYPDGFTVPMGQTAEIQGLVTTPANVVVEGTLRMRPGSTLRFRDVDESQFVGGHTHMPLATDVGLWVVGHGVLDVEGTPREGWNRTGDHPSWQPGDEVRVTPTAQGDFSTFAPFTPGDPVPQAYPEVPAAEVANLTRDVVIEGTPDGRAHVMFLHAHQPSTIRWATIRNVAPAALGRYGLHWHHCHDGSRGTLVEGVVVRDAGGPCYVPHLSHGITMRDVIAADAPRAFWWDAPEDGHLCRVAPFEDECSMTDDCTVEHMLAVRIGVGLNEFIDACLLAQGHNNVMRDCVTAAVGGRTNAAGFHWPSFANQSPNLWEFVDCVAHNCEFNGIFVWQNDGRPHIIDRFTAYNNGIAGVEHGAYKNPYRYRDSVLIGNGARRGSGSRTQLVQHSNSSLNTETGTGAGYERVVFDGTGQRDTAATITRRHKLDGQHPIEWVECTFRNSEYAHELRETSGSGSAHPAEHRFVRCLVDDGGLRDMEPSDVLVTANENGCTVTGVRRDGTTWQAA